MDDTQTIGDLFKAVWNAFPNNPDARGRIYEALDREVGWGQGHASQP